MLKKILLGLGVVIHLFVHLIPLNIQTRDWKSL